MIKSFNEMRAIDISPYVKERDGISYLPWARCKDILHKNGAEKVYFEPVLSKEGSSLFMTEKEFVDKDKKTNRCYEVEVKIVIDDLTFNMRSPLMNGANPVKDNSLSQQRVWNAQTRAFVKGVAIHTGLGFDLWLDDEALPPETDETDDINSHNIMTIKKRCQELYTSKMMKNMSTKDIAEALGKTEDEVKAIFSYFEIIRKFEEDLTKI